MEKKARKIGKRIAVFFLVLFLIVLTVLGVGWLGVFIADVSWEHYRPDYPKEDLTLLIYQETLQEQDYGKIYRQTGLTKVAVDDLRGKGAQQKILEAQDAFFQENKVTNSRFAPFFYQEMLEKQVPIVALQDGDIILSAAMRGSFYRYGHAGLVVDADYGLVLEAMEPNSKTVISPVQEFSDLASFMVLRPKVAKETREQVANYAKQNLIGLDYSLTAGIFGDKYREDITSTQCSHLVWYAYQTYGIDLDSDGGKIVTPRDLFSEQTEVVQVYGFDLDKLWR